MSETATLSPLCRRCGRAALEPSGLAGCAWCLEDDLRSDEWLELWESGLEEDGWDGFILGGEIGAGGMGVVYRARQISPARDVALKVLSTGLAGRDGARQRLLAEAEALAEMDHPGILPLYASGEKDGCPWLAMKLAGGGSLAAQTGSWAGRWADIALLGAGLADAVQHAHERGVIHRDLKPANILFDDAGRAFVADFGLAKWTQRDDGRTVSHAVLGTPAYMAPEVARAGAGAATTAGDVYGLGAILYELAAGRPPFAGPTAVETARQVIADVVKPPRMHRPDVPRDLEAVVLKSLASEPAKRYASAGALAEDLRAFAAGRPVSARRPSAVERSWLWARRHPLPAALVAAILAITAAGGILLWGAFGREKTARGDSENLLAFMIRTLPAKLEPAGQLGVLDSVFEETAGYYDRRGATDATALARRADFQTQWAAVLKKQGRLDEAHERARQAGASALLATRAPHAGPDAWVALAAAHRRQAELEILDADFDKADANLSAALAAVEAGLSASLGSAALLIEKVESLNERAFGSLKRGDAAAAIRLYDEAEAVLAGVPAPVDVGEEARLKHLRLVAGSYAGEALMAAKKFPEAARRYTDHLAMIEAACAAEPANVTIKSSLKVALNHLADALAPQADSQLERRVALWQRAEEVAAALAAGDKTNLQWQAEWALTALAVAQGAHMRGDKAASRAWLEKTVERLAPVPVGAHNDVLAGRSNALLYLTRNLDKSDAWDAGRARCLEAMEASWQWLEHDAAQPAAHKRFQKEFQELFTIWKRREPAEAAPLAAKFIARADATTSVGPAQPWWRLTAASLHRRLADASKSPQENIAALRIRAGVLQQAGDESLAAEALKESISAAKAVLNGPPSAAQAGEAARLVIDLAPRIVQAGAAQVEAAAQAVAGLLAKADEGERKTLAAAAITGFFSQSTASGGACETLTSLAQ